jgi:hypothetical protein
MHLSITVTMRYKFIYNKKKYKNRLDEWEN